MDIPFPDTTGFSPARLVMLMFGSSATDEAGAFRPSLAKWGR
jgi:hypothetical protein